MRRTRALSAVLLSLGAAGAMFTSAADAGGGTGASGIVNVNCFPKKATKNAVPIPRAEPRSCNIQGRPRDAAHLLVLSKTKWTGWGGPTATGRGVAARTGSAPSSVTVKLSWITIGCHSRSFYTRATVSTSSGTRTLKLSASDGC